MKRFMYNAWCVVLFTLCLFWAGEQLAQAERVLQHRTVRLVVPQMKHDKLVLTWYTHTGSKMLYTIHPSSHPGWLIRLKRFDRKYKQNIVAVGGRFFQNTDKGGWVKLQFVRRVAQTFHGVRVAKLDGQMPLFHTSVLPRYRYDRLKVYKMWGKIRSGYRKHQNKLVCVYGTWFDFFGRELGLLQQDGEAIKGAPLYQYSKAFEAPDGLFPFINWRKVLLRYQKRKKQNIPLRTFPKVPILKEKFANYFLKTCQKRISKLERKQQSPYDPALVGNHFFSFHNLESTNTPSALPFPPLPTSWFPLP